MSKKIKILLISILLFVLSAGVVNANTLNAELKTNSQNVKPGETFTVTFKAACQEGINGLESKISYDEEKLEVIDIATPVTYERYCSSYKGSWMTVWKKGKAKPRIPQKYKGIKNLYFAGQRIFMCGGLPIAVYSGRRAVQLLCKDLGIIFV